MSKVKVPISPGRTSLVSSSRAGPQTVLSAGLCDPSRNAPERVHVDAPVFRMVTLTRRVWLTRIAWGADCSRNSASLAVVRFQRAERRFANVWLLKLPDMAA